MRKNLFILFTVCCIALSINWFLYRKPDLSGLQRIAPDIVLTDLDGASFSLNDKMRNDGMVIHFWATWCPPCIKELPSLFERAAQEKEIAFIIVSVDRNADTARQFLKRYDTHIAGQGQITLAHDASASVTQNIFKISTFPETLILSPQYTVRRHIRGEAPWARLDITP